MQELDCEAVGETQGWDTPATFSGLQTLQSAVEQAQHLNPVSQEGFVAVDKRFRRVKIKSPGYVALHHLGSNVDRGVLSTTDPRLRRRRLLEISRTREGAEFLCYYPELCEEFSVVSATLASLRTLLDEDDTQLRREQLLRFPALSQLVLQLRAKMVAKSQSAAALLASMAIRALEDAADRVDGFVEACVNALPATPEPRSPTCRQPTSTTPTVSTAPIGRSFDFDFDADGDASSQRSDSDTSTEADVKRPTRNGFAGLLIESDSDSDPNSDSGG